MNPFGFNVHLRYVKDYGRLISRMQAIQPAVLTVLIDKDEQKSYIKELAAAFPRTLIVARRWHQQDGAYYTMPVADPDHREWVASPIDFLNTWGDLGQGNMALYALNEPSSKLNDYLMSRLIAWCEQTVEEAVRRNISLVLPNFGTGQPQLNSASPNEWDTRFDPLVRLLSKHRNQGIYLGLHEYLPGEPYRVGRLMFMLARCKALEIPAPKVIITEFGVDAESGEDKRNGYQSRGWSGEQYVRTLVDVYKRTYSALISQGDLIGTCLFCYGNSGGWDSFDVENDQPFFNTLQALIASGGMNQTKPIPVIDVPKPVETPAPIPAKPADPPAPVELPPAETPKPERKERRLEIVVTATDEEWAQMSILAESAVAALSKFAGMSEQIKVFLPRLVIHDLSAKEAQTL